MLRTVIPVRWASSSMVRASSWAARSDASVTSDTASSYRVSCDMDRCNVSPWHSPTSSRLRRPSPPPSPPAARRSTRSPSPRAWPASPRRSCWPGSSATAAATTAARPGARCGAWPACPSAPPACRRGPPCPPGCSEPASGLPGWAALPAGLAGGSLLVALLGMYWDISLHIDQGRDPGPLANPAHYLILVGLYGVFAAGCLPLALPEEKPGPAAIRITRDWYVPVGGVLTAGCGGFALLGFPLDDMWHRLFGQDVTLWGPTHLMLFGGAGLTLIGQAILLAEGLRFRGVTTDRLRDSQFLVAL